MIRSSKPFVAVRAFEPLITRVGPLVPRQLVRAGKVLPAALVITAVRFLPVVRPDVGLEVTRLEVLVGAALHGARVDLLLALDPLFLFRAVAVDAWAALAVGVNFGLHSFHFFLSNLGGRRRPWHC